MTEAAPSGTGLVGLLAPFSSERFLTGHWPRHHLFVDGPAGGRSALCELTPLRSIEDLFASWQERVFVILPDRDDESSFVHVPVREARALFDAGMTVQFPAAQVQLPTLRIWLDGLSRDLGMAMPDGGRCMLYASPAGRGVRPHFDANANFIVQLVGSKQWWIAENRSIEWPPARHVGGRDISPDLAACRPGDLSGMPADAGSYELTRGSLLFLPAGYWHRTQAGTPSLSLNFTFHQPSWAELLGRLISRRLVRHAHWRALATRAGADPSSRPAAFRALLDRLVPDLGDLSDGAILEELRGARRCLEIATGAAIDATGGTVTVTVNGAPLDLDLDADFLPLLEWIAARPSRFTDLDAAAAVVRLSAAEIAGALQALLDTGVLRELVDD